MLRVATGMNFVTGRVVRAGPGRQEGVELPFLEAFQRGVNVTLWDTV